MAKELYCPQCNTEFWGDLSVNSLCGGCGHDFAKGFQNGTLDVISPTGKKYLWRTTYPDGEVEYNITNDRVSEMAEVERLNKLHYPEKVKVELVDYATIEI